MASRQEPIPEGWEPVSGHHHHAGLININETCYQNSVLQALFHIPAFITILTVEGPQCKKNPCTSLLCAVYSVFCEMKKNKTVSPTAITSLYPLHFKLFQLGRQEDAHEFLVQFVEIISSELQSRILQRLEGDPAVDIIPATYRCFGGLLGLTGICSCKSIHEVDDFYLHLFMPLSHDTNSIQRGIEQLLNETEDVLHDCEACKKKMAIFHNSVKVKYYPQYLVVQFPKES
ncbi:ubiquitin carboxyl-terminal hydrolase 36-like [Thrips palmi]|uniref:Ubiquitin carboxyl-terminal hydrolase 36 n=1 Tax=Thrips palmi TaxID=161013 RepID=A0A6P8Z1K4_THRPL|nr:ubiquitin carboxyl-terminal hydrolase 36-like [Thrips palmi]